MTDTRTRAEGALLGKILSDRLFDTIRTEHSLCYSTSAGLTGYDAAGCLQTHVGCQPQNAAQAHELLRDGVLELHRDGVQEDELQLAQAMLATEAVLDQEGCHDVAHLIAHLAVLRHQDPVVPLAFATAVENMTVADMNAALQRLRVQDGFCLATAGPNPATDFPTDLPN